MTDFIELKAASRDVIGKANRRLAADGLIPAVLYGHNVEPTSVAIDRHTFEYLMTHEALASTILKVAIDDSSDPVNALVKEIQTHPVTGKVLHIDIFAISMKQKIQTAVPLHLVGDSAGVKEGGTVTQSLVEIEIEALPTDLPDFIEADITELGIGDGLHVVDLTAPEGVEIVSDPTLMVVSITIAKVVEEEVEGEELGEGEVPEVGDEAADEAASEAEEE